MSIRIKVISVIVLINLAIILFSVFAGVKFVETSVERAAETDLEVIADIADHFISNEIENLKLKAGEMSRNLQAALPEEWNEVLARQKELYPDFIGTAVYNSGGELFAFSGESPAPPLMIRDRYVAEAFSGEKILSTTHPSPDGVVFYLAVPVPGYEGRILVITVPGMYFSLRLSTFVIWETGHIFIDDAEGTVVANIREEWVEERYNFVHMAETDSEYEGIASVVELMIQGETGIGHFSIQGVPRICAYRPITKSVAGWCLGVVAPLPESPARNTDRGMFVVGLVCLLLSVIAALIASFFIEKPFKELAVLKEEADANSQSKTNFLATMSHEMRTPLNAVIGLTQLTLDGKIEGEERENIEMVYTAGVTLLGIINTILDISKIESGKFEMTPAEYDVPSLINDTIMLNSMRIGEKPIVFKLHIDESFPAKLLGDELRIKQVFSNLLSNAFKYTKAGTVEWRVSWEKTDGDIWLISSVIDSGIGIKEEDLDKLFQNYSQVDSGAHRKIEGTGLGLALAKRMVELMDGSISVESEYGKGSTFTFRIRQGFVSDSPIGHSMAESLMSFNYTARKQESHSQLVRVHIPYARVLVVDDLLSNLAVVRGIMKPYGMQVDCVTSGAEAVRLIREGVKYHAIFMDHMMPEMNGIEAVQIIRNDIGTEYARTVPIIALTANAVRGNEKLFLASGFQAFLSKPIDILQMDAVIRQWVRNKEQEKIYEPEAAASETANENGVIKGIEGIDLEMILEQLGGDEESLMEILRICVEQIPPVLRRIKSAVPELIAGKPALDGGEDERASFQAKLSAYVIDVHGIKGTCRNMYAEKAGAMAEALERAGKSGDLSFIEKNNTALIETVEKLLASVREWLG